MRWLELDACRVDLETGDVTPRSGAAGGGSIAAVRLTTRELALLRSLSERPGEPIARDVLLGEVFGYAPNTVSRAVDKAMDSLRAKVERDKRAPVHLVTVHGHGYRFVPAAPQTPPATAGRWGNGSAGDEFVGREAEMDALRDAITTAGLVTVLGPGGAGKTRLVREVLGGGVRPLALCDLSGCDTTVDVLGALERTLAIPPAARGLDARIARIGDAIAAGDRWLVLDSAERVVGPLRALAPAWSAAGPALVVTSRIRLDLPGERVVCVEGLTRAAAVALFLARAGGSADRAERSDLDDVAAVTDLVDGIPLAIELAARRCRLLTPRELRKRLGTTFALLSGATDPHPPRHRDVGRTVAWSWELLSPAEQEALWQATVFEGGFDLDAAEAVIAPTAPAPPVADLVSALLDASLLRRTHDDRFALYEVVRPFARDAAPADADARRALAERHGRWYGALGHALSAAVRFGVEPLDQLERELGNLRAVYAPGSAAFAEDRVRARLAVHAWMRIRGAYPERGPLLDAAVADAAGLGGEVRATALNARALLDGYRGVAPADDAFDEAEAIARRSDDPELLVRTLTCKALCLRMARRVDEAARAIAEAEVIEVADVWVRVNLAQEVAALAIDRTGDGASPDALAAVVDQAAEAGFVWMEAIGRINLGRIHLRRDHPIEARRQLIRGLELGLALRSTHLQQLAERSLAAVSRDLGAWDDVDHHARRALRLGRSEGDPETVADAHLLLALRALRDHHDPRADTRAEAEAAEGLAARCVTQPTLGMLALVRAVALARLGRAVEARDVLDGLDAQPADPMYRRQVDATRPIAAALVDIHVGDPMARERRAAELAELVAQTHAGNAWVLAEEARRVLRQRGASWRPRLAE